MNVPSVLVRGAAAAFAALALGLSVISVASGRQQPAHDSDRRRVLSEIDSLLRRVNQVERQIRYMASHLRAADRIRVWPAQGFRTRIRSLEQRASLLQLEPLRRNRGGYEGAHDVVAIATYVADHKEMLVDPTVPSAVRATILGDLMSLPLATAFMDRDIAISWLSDLYHITDPKDRAEFIILGRHLVGWHSRIRDALVFEVIQSRSEQVRIAAATVLRRHREDPVVIDLMRSLASRNASGSLRRLAERFLESIE